MFTKKTIFPLIRRDSQQKSVDQPAPLYLIFQEKFPVQEGLDSRKSMDIRLIMETPSMQGIQNKKAS